MVQMMSFHAIVSIPWWYWLIFDPNWRYRLTDRRTDGPTDQRTNTVSDGRSLRQTMGPTDGPTDRPTNGYSLRSEVSQCKSILPWFQLIFDQNRPCIFIVTDRPADQPRNGPADRPTDIASYRDSWTNLKILPGMEKEVEEKRIPFTLQPKRVNQIS